MVTVQRRIMILMESMMQIKQKTIQLSAFKKLHVSDNKSLYLIRSKRLIIKWQFEAHIAKNVLSF